MEILETNCFITKGLESTRCAPLYKLTNFVAMATCRFQTPQIWKALPATFGVLFSYLRTVPHLRDPARICKDEFVALVNVFSSFKSPKILKSGWEDCKRVSYHGEQSFYSSRCVACRTISLPSVNGLSCKLTEIAPFIHLCHFGLSESHQ